MKRSQLREVIKSIVSRKLAENSQGGYGRDMMTATYVKNHAEWDDFDRVKVITHYGSHELEIMECWVDQSKKTLMLSVQADVPPKLEEIAPVSTSSSTSTSSGTTPSTTQNQDDDSDQMSDSDRNQIASLQKDQAKLTNDSQRIEGAVSKLREPLERKIGQLEKRKADVQRKLGTVTDKIKRIQDKYSKVFESITEDGMHLVKDPKYTFSVAFKTKFDSPKIKKELTHRIDVFPAHSKEELPQAIQAWLDGYVNDAKAKGRTGITWELLPNTLQVFSQDKV